MRIFVTGSAAQLGYALLPMLCSLPEVSEVYGIDIRPTPFIHPKFSSSIGDIRSPSLASLMNGYDALVHLAFVVHKGSLAIDEVYDIDVNGGKNVFLSAQKAGVRRLVNVSSCSVYGPGHSHTEQAPLRPTFEYAKHKALLEEWLESNYPSAISLRVHLIIGPNSHQFLKEMCTAPVYISFPPPRPLMQCVHERDVAIAILAALRSEVGGAYNIAAPEPFCLSDFMRRGRKLIVPLPVSLARRMVKLARALGSKEEHLWLDIVDNTLTIDCSRARNALGWAATSSPWEARSDMRSGH